MAVSTGVSFLLATTLSVVLFAGMQMYRSQLAGQDYMTIVGGFLGSNLFVLLLTAVGNFETSTFGSTFQTKLFPEVITCLFLALFACGLIHRVCVTTCLIFSLVAIYYINRISLSKYSAPVPVVGGPTPSKKKKRN